PPPPPLFPYTTLFRSAAARTDYDPRLPRHTTRAADRASAPDWRSRPVRLLAQEWTACGPRCVGAALPYCLPSVAARSAWPVPRRSEEHTSELQSRSDL